MVSDKFAGIVALLAGLGITGGVAYYLLKDKVNDAKFKYRLEEMKKKYKELWQDAEESGTNSLPNEQQSAVNQYVEDVSAQTNLGESDLTDLHAQLSGALLAYNNAIAAGDAYAAYIAFLTIQGIQTELEGQV